MKTDIWENLETARKHLIEINENGFVPGYMEMQRKYGRYFIDRIRKLGGYKKVVGEIGFKKYFTASDGHILLSYYEYLFDEYLYLNNIPHDVDKNICDKYNHRYDFKIEDVYVEIWGISKVHSKIFNNYYERKLKKEKLYKDHNLKLISIEHTDFRYNSKDLQTFFKNKLKEFDIYSQDNKVEYPIFNSRKKIGYWCDEIIIKELKIIIKETKKFPTSNELLKTNKISLRTAIVQFGGYRKFAKILGFKPQTKKYCEKILINELIEIKGKLGHFPCDRELQKIRRSDLAGLIKRHGGYGYFKEKIDGKRDKRPYGYWDKEENIKNELKILYNKMGRFPRYTELGNIAKGIAKSDKNLEYFKNKISL